jgi:hypothetical protein
MYAFAGVRQEADELEQARPSRNCASKLLRSPVQGDN